MVDKLEKIWLDGKFVNWDDANVHILTHTLHYGVGAFEGIRAYQTKDGKTSIFRFREHIERLFDSCSTYQLKIPYTVDELMNAAVELIKINKLKSCYIRPLVFLGSEAMGLYAPNNSVRVSIIVWQWGAYLGKAGLENGIKGKISSFFRNHTSNLPKAKISGNYINSILAKREAKNAGYDEAIMMDSNGYITECSGENIFVVKKGKIYTPSAGLPLLPGLTRDSVINIIKDFNIPFEETIFGRDFLYLADEIFVVGTAAEITPMTTVDDRVIGTGKPGEFTKKIQQKYFDVVNVTDENYHSEWYTFI